VRGGAEQQKHGLRVRIDRQRHEKLTPSLPTQRGIPGKAVILHCNIF
jgi:hypothetical protein